MYTVLKFINLQCYLSKFHQTYAIILNRCFGGRFCSGSLQPRSSGTATAVRTLTLSHSPAPLFGIWIEPPLLLHQPQFWAAFYVPPVYCRYKLCSKTGVPHSTGTPRFWPVKWGAEEEAWLNFKGALSLSFGFSAWTRERAIRGESTVKPFDLRQISVKLIFADIGP